MWEMLQDFILCSTWDKDRPSWSTDQIASAMVSDLQDFMGPLSLYLTPCNNRHRYNGGAWEHADYKLFDKKKFKGIYGKYFLENYVFH